MSEPASPRAAVVAGASSGIGAAIGKRLAAAGHPVALGARRVDRCAALAEEIRASGGHAIACALDVADSSSVAEFADAVTGELGPVDVVVAAAAVMSPGRLWEVDDADLTTTLETNVGGVARLIRAFVPAMVARRRGDLVVISSDVAGLPRPLIGHYVASKWAVEGLTRTLQMELEGTGVRASLVRPGPTATEIGAGWDMDDAVRVVEAGKKFGSLRHYGWLEAEAVADAVVHVVSAAPGVHLAMTHIDPVAPASG